MAPNKKLSRLERLIDRHEQNPGESTAIAVIRQLRKNRRLDEAFAWVRRAKNNFPASRKINKLYQKIRTDKMANSLKQLKARVRSDASATHLVQLSDLLRISGAWKKANRVAQKARKRFPDDWQVSLLLGKLHFDRFSASRSEDEGWTAVEHLEGARALNPHNYQTLLTLAIALTRLQSYDGALEVVEDILVLRPGDPRALGLRKYANHARQEQDRAGGGEDAGVETAEVSGVLEATLSINGAVGAFLLDSSGKSFEKRTRGGAVFTFDKSEDAVQSMANACQMDTRRLGLGDLVSCSVSGDDWFLMYRPSPLGQLMAFFEGDLDMTEIREQIEAAVTNSCTAGSTGELQCARS